MERNRLEVVKVDDRLTIIKITYVEYWREN